MAKPSLRAQALTLSEFRFYLKFKALLVLYKEIKQSGSGVQEVVNFYHSLAAMTFPVPDGFLIIPGMAIGTPSNVKHGYGISYIRTVDVPRISIYKDQRREPEPQSEDWAGALATAVSYAVKERSKSLKSGKKQYSMFLAVAMGSYLRFYELMPDDDEAKEWEPAGNRLFELADDEEEVWRLWLQIRKVIESEHENVKPLDQEPLSK